MLEIAESISEDALRESSAKLFPLGTLLVAMYGATVGKLGVLTQPAATNQAVCAIFPSPTVDSKFLFWFLRSSREALISQAVGGAQPNISQGVIRSLRIPVPPLDEQREIVAEIEKQVSRLDEAVANLQRVKANLKRYKAAILNAAVDGRLVPTDAELATREGRHSITAEAFAEWILSSRRTKWQGKSKVKEPAKPDAEATLAAPKGWAIVSWEAVLEPADGAFKRGPFGSALTKSIFVDAGYKVYEQYCPINDDCSYARYYITPEKFEEMRVFEVKAGDFLISCSGSLGRITRIPELFEKGVINQALLRVRIDTQVVDPTFFLYVFRSPRFQRFVFDRSAGAAIPNMRGVAELKAIPIAVPPLSEQIRIVAEVDRRLSVVREVEAEVDANVQRAQALRQAALAAAFSQRD